VIVLLFHTISIYINKKMDDNRDDNRDDDRNRGEYKPKSGAPGRILYLITLIILVIVFY
jgi:hypothetical protein